MVANNQSILYNPETHTETPLPPLPNSVRVTNPYDGTATLLPLSPPSYIPSVLVCGGTNKSDNLATGGPGGTPVVLDSQDVASDQCSRIELTEAGVKKGWEVERLLEPRMMPEMIMLPDGRVVIVNGAQTGYAALADVTVQNPVGGGNADHPACVVYSLFLLLHSPHCDDVGSRHQSIRPTHLSVNGSAIRVCQRLISLGCTILALL
jgi:hypothetical protein